MKLRSIPGGVPEPDELVGREHLLELLWNQLEGNNILLIAPRRFGKTGVMRHVLKRPRPDYLPVYLDVEELNTPQAFAAELIAALATRSQVRRFVLGAKRLPKQVMDFFSDRVEEVRVEEFKVRLRESLKETWKEATRRLVLELEKAEATVVFIIDEFPQLIENISRHEDEDTARSFLAWFRSLRMKQKDELRRFRFIIGGSTGIDVIMRRLKASDKINDFFRLPVEPVSRADGERIIKGLAKNYGLDFSSEAIETLFQLIGPPVPYFIHLFVSQIMVSSNLKGKRLTPDEIQSVYDQRVIGPTCRSYFDYFRRRLERYGQNGEKAAMAILRAIAADPNERVADSMLYDVYLKLRKKEANDVEFREIMADLECDWYVFLDIKTNEYYFLMNIMKAWWGRFYRSIVRRKG